MVLPPPLRRRVRQTVVRRRYRGLGPSDAFVISFPKSGSSWLRMLLSHAITGDESDFDSIRRTVPPIGGHQRAAPILPGQGRLIRSHEPIRRELDLRAHPIVYLVRDGRDVAVSYFHHHQKMGTFAGSLDEFSARFIEGRVDNFGPWHRHVELACERRQAQPGRFCLVRYEDVLRAADTAVGEVLHFLGVEVDTSLVSEAVAACSIGRMRDKERRSSFLDGRGDPSRPLVREGRAGSWRNHLSQESAEQFWDVAGATLSAVGYEP